MFRDESKQTQITEATQMRLKTKKLLVFGIAFATATTVYSQNSYDIKKALQTARINNTQLKSEQLNTKMADADIVTAKLRPNLTLNNQSLQSTNSAYHAPNTSYIDGKNRQIWWQLTKEFQIAGQRRNKIDLADKSKIVTDANFQEFQRNLLTEVAMNWLDAWLSQKKWKASMLAKSNWDTLVNINKNRFKNQVITATELSRTELIASQYNVTAQTAKMDYDNNLNSLRYLMGIDETIAVPESDVIDWEEFTSLEQLLTQAIEQRSDIKVLKSAIEASKSNISLQKSLAYPKPELGVIYNPQNSVPYAGIFATIDLPFFDRNQGEIQKSKVMQSKTEQELATTKARLKTEIENAYLSYKQFQQNMLNLKNMREQSHTILDNVKYAYMRGGTTLIDVLEAQRMWYETQNNYYDAVFMHKEGYIKLLFTTGLINQIAQ